MAVDVLTETVIGAPCDIVAAYVADPSNAPEWYVNIVSVEWETESEVRVGARAAFVARFLGRRLVYTYEIVAYEPGRRLVMRADQGPFPMETTYTWEPYGPEGDHTRMTLRNRGGGGGRVLAAAMRRANRKDLAMLRHLLETRYGPGA
ncbi:ATPase [Streptomyces sp. WAC05374]|uniref:SRPBCC family protein n=1 Tax=unclassified Streptomyces TaxID=2593676 RepID=UPI000F89CDC0|nr:SRPBCC family protein [Streptomyces sp. WAC05374]RST12654.1 ATPase [Streptomyces sp. WAC05374]TDF47275.1 ATPase [Streptomyces sp. WAC05374]TDF57533.1 ATPase [Streptomyces sp. WAC05374]TDF61638.1 ATPase [Streptomyces sp. WAC05374]